MKRIRFVQRRRTVGLTQEVLAEQLHVDVSTVRRWEHGQSEPQPWQRSNLAMALKVSVEALNDLLSDRSEGRYSLTPFLQALPLPQTSEQTDDDMAVMDAFRLADRQAGGGQLYATMTDYLKQTVAPRLLGGVEEDEKLFAAAAGLTQVAGWMAHEAGRDDAANRHFHRALRLAVAAGDTELAADVMIGLSHVANQHGQPAAAVAYARRGGVYLTVSRPNRDVEARLHAMAARGFAAIRQEKECTAQLKSAEQALKREPDPNASPWTSQFDHAALAMESARCFRALGQFESAKRAAETVLTVRPADRPRSRGFAQLSLASVLIAEGKIDEACHAGREALDSTVSVSSSPLLHQFARLGRQLDGHRRNHDVAAFLELLQPELAARHQRLGIASS
ncbi:helix-turn-helix domain-containing protein [Allorhizocola rhizosphaerae]|uniref:helix-turn-helix domain-containing protein n=1 Tax=Allorhizocola rhizosphaerae TaxID=1872709 RepID=UPI0013C2FE0B|nr:helix-turn-helix transcriptional regulator [Allorhizocola rhizosphaerae]